jgi:hypothetical protein
MDGYISKPIGHAELVAAMASALPVDRTEGSRVLGF